MIGDLVAFLLGNNDIASIVGTRIFPLRVPEGETFPCIVFQQISGPRVYSLSGPNACNYPRIQLKCWGLTYTDAKGLADTVDNLLDGFRGTMVNTQIQAILNAGVVDGEESPENANDVARYSVALDYIIWYQKG
jgi:hypothetical protein